MTPTDRKPSDERPPDIEIGATAKADRARFKERPDAKVEFHGESVAESGSGSKRQNLPDEVEPNVTYRDVRIGWSAAAWIDEPQEDLAHVKKGNSDE